MSYNKLHIKPDKKIQIDFEEILHTLPAKVAWKKYRAYLKLEKPLLTKLQKQEKHKIYWQWINALSNEPIDVKLNIGKMYCQAYDHIQYIDTYTQKAIFNFFDTSIDDIKSIVNLYLYQNYENDPKKLRWLACFGGNGLENPYAPQELPSDYSLLHQALKINPHDLDCKKALFFMSIGVLSSAIYWATDSEFHFHVDPNDFAYYLNDTMHWANDFNQTKLWEAIVKKAQLIEFNDVMKEYFKENYPLKNTRFFEYLKLKKKNNLIENWPSWFYFGFFSAEYYSDDVVTDVRLNLEKLYQSSFQNTETC